MKKEITFDLESYINYALFAFRDKKAPNKLRTFELRGDDSYLSQKQIKKIRKIISSVKFRWLHFLFNALY